MDEIWSEVDGFIESYLHASDPILAAAVASGREAGLPQIQVSAAQGKLLSILARAIGARQVLEIGTLAGYSGIWLTRSLPHDGRLVTIEADPHHAAVAAANFADAGISDQVDLRVGAALDVLPTLEREGSGPFDLTFIDADKPNNSAYLQWAQRLSRPGSIIVLDNVVRGGDVLDRTKGLNAAGAHDAVRWLGTQPGLDSTVVQTVGAKGYDGFAIAIVG